jgi:hypothetical protein
VAITAAGLRCLMLGGSTTPSSSMGCSMFRCRSIFSPMLLLLFLLPSASPSPPDLEARGVFEVVLADEGGAPRAESVVAGPLVLLEDPAGLGLALLD